MKFIRSIGPDLAGATRYVWEDDDGQQVWLKYTKAMPLPAKPELDKTMKDNVTAAMLARRKMALDEKTQLAETERQRKLDAIRDTGATAVVIGGKVVPIDEAIAVSAPVAEEPIEEPIEP